MDRTLEIIPISSRRRAEPARSLPQIGAGESSTGRGRFVLALGAALAIVGAVSLSRIHEIGSIRGLPPAERTALYHRTFDDTAADCATPDARSGALRDHCVGQAEFLQLFPECDARCRSLTTAILPHARR